MHFVELCAGSAAMTLYLMGYGRPLVSYAGGKGGYAAAISRILKLERPTELTLVDPSPWGRTLHALTSDKASCARVAELIKRWKDQPAKQLWERSGRHVELGDCDNQTFATYHLLLVAGTHGGHEKGGFKGPHKLRSNVDGFIPKRETLVKRIEKLAKVDWPPLRVIREEAAEIIPFGDFCYIDPPYAKCNTKYSHEFPREDVIATAKRWHEAGTSVAISENEPIPELVTEGWHPINITNERKGQSRKNSQTATEWLTVSPEISLQT